MLYALAISARRLEGFYEWLLMFMFIDTMIILYTHERKYGENLPHLPIIDVFSNIIILFYLVVPYTFANILNKNNNINTINVFLLGLTIVVLLRTMFTYLLGKKFYFNKYYNP